MNDSARILIADDEAMFLESTADLLRREGYQCDCVTTAEQAAKKLFEKPYDVLICDIKMPGNAEMEFVSRLPDQDTQVIIVTGYPEIHSAIQSVELSVRAYLVKPIPFDELLRQVRLAVARSRLHRYIRTMRQRLNDWQRDAVAIETLIEGETAKGNALSVETFLEVTFKNLVSTLSDMRNLVKGVAATRSTTAVDVCHLMDCPRLQSLEKMLRETIAVLEQSKTSFKSKTLGQVRKKLQVALESKTEVKEN